MNRQEQRLIVVLLGVFLGLPRRTQLLLAAAVALLLLGWFWAHHHRRVVLSPTGAVTGPCADKVPYGAPVSGAAPDATLGEVRLVCRSGYLVGYSGVTKTPLWVAEHLQADAIYGQEPRTNEFLEDPTVPAGERAMLSDYSRSGYDRGHMAPAADFSRSANDMAESFYLSNMVPQFPENNRGPWAKLEGHVRAIAKDAEDLYVVTGPVFTATEPKTIGRSHVRVPDQLFKIALDARHGRLGAWLLPNAEVPVEDWNRYCTTTSAIESATGLTFFPQLPADERTALVGQSCAL